MQRIAAINRLAQRGVKPGIESNGEQGNAEWNEEVGPWEKEGKQHQRAEQTRPQPQNHDRPSMAVSETHEAVMNVVLIGGVPARP
jgi:hypothetical protein